MAVTPTVVAIETFDFSIPVGAEALSMIFQVETPGRNSIIYEGRRVAGGAAFFYSLVNKKKPQGDDPCGSTKMTIALLPSLRQSPLPAIYAEGGLSLTPSEFTFVFSLA